jgi:chorismate mutase
MRTLPTRDGVRQQLAASQGRYSSKDPLVQRRIEKMFNDLRTAADKHLDPAIIERIAKSAR